MQKINDNEFSNKEKDELNKNKNSIRRAYRIY